MPMSKSYLYVKIHYGPNESFHSYIHRPQKLKGLRDSLIGLGYRVDLVPEKIGNYCMIELCGHNVFQCDINNFLFNRPTLQDPVSARAVNAVLDATEMILRADNHYWVWMQLEDQLFRRIFYKQDLGPYKLKSQLPYDEIYECCKDLVNCRTSKEIYQKYEEELKHDAGEETLEHGTGDEDLDDRNGDAGDDSETYLSICD